MADAMLERWESDLKKAEEMLGRLKNQRFEDGHEAEVADWESRAEQARRKIAEGKLRLRGAGKLDLDDDT